MMRETDKPEIRVEDLEALYGLCRQLLQLQGYEEILDALVQQALSILEAERGFLVLQREEGLDLKVVRNWSREELEGGGEPVSRSIIADVLTRGEPVLIEDALEDDRFAEAKSVLRMGIRSVLAAPLRVDGEICGALYLEASAVKSLFGPRQFHLFLEILELGSKALEAATRRILLEQRASLAERDFLARFDFPGIVTQDPTLLRLLKTVAQIAPADLPVLVQGASGTGKELISRALHLNSRRSRKPFVTLNCGAISPALLESELFGHVKGAFTGAHRDKTGLISSADGGSLFLDEVGELPKELQVKLLRTIQFGEVQPVGSTRSSEVDVRFIAATNRDLESQVAKGEFREDLFYRLNAVTLEVPPLAERPGDVLPLFFHFLEREAAKQNRSVPRVSPKLERALQVYSWPGNVRELQNEARRALAVTPDDVPLTVDSLSPRLTETSSPSARPGSLADQEKELIELHLRHSGGNRTHAAQSLGISREGLRKKMKRYGLS